MQYHLHQNLGTSQRQAPFLLDIQSAIWDKLTTRVVIPLYPIDQLPGKPLGTLTPQIDIETVPHFLFTPYMAAIPSQWLGEVIQDCREQSHTIVNAMDALLSGV